MKKIQLALDNIRFIELLTDEDTSDILNACEEFEQTEQFINNKWIDLDLVKFIQERLLNVYLIPKKIHQRIDLLTNEIDYL